VGWGPPPLTGHTDEPLEPVMPACAGSFGPVTSLQSPPSGHISQRLSAQSAIYMGCAGDSPASDGFLDTITFSHHDNGFATVRRFYP
jgi:hypothetical protein